MSEEGQKDLSAQLSGSSSHFARSALQGFPSGEYATFALHAGTAVEQLAKALLARRHPALIAAHDFDSLLHACGDSDFAQRTVMRTITVAESLRRAARFVPPLGNLLPQLEVLAEARNGVAHLGHAGQAEDLRLPFLKASELLRDALDLPRQDFWGEFEPLVDAALEESVKEAKVRAANAIAAARVEFETRYGHLDHDARIGVLHAI